MPYRLRGTSHQVSNIAFSGRGQRGRGALCFWPRYTKVMLCMRWSQSPKSVHASPFSGRLLGVHVPPFFSSGCDQRQRAYMRHLFPVRAGASVCHLLFQQVVTNAKQRPCVTFFLCALGRLCGICFSAGCDQRQRASMPHLFPARPGHQCYISFSSGCDQRQRAAKRRLFPVRSRASMCHLFFQQVVTRAKERTCVTFFLCALGRLCAACFFSRL